MCPASSVRRKGSIKVLLRDNQTAVKGEEKTVVENWRRFGHSPPSASVSFCKGSFRHTTPRTAGRHKIRSKCTHPQRTDPSRCFRRRPIRQTGGAMQREEREAQIRFHPMLSFIERITEVVLRLVGVCWGYPWGCGDLRYLPCFEKYIFWLYGISGDITSQLCEKQSTRRCGILVFV